MPTETACLESGFPRGGRAYFFTLLTDRFAPLAERWAKQLHVYTGRQYAPIYVLPAKPDSKFEPQNYVVLNPSSNEEDVLIPYQADLNRAFSNSRLIDTLATRLSASQEVTYVVGWSNVWLTPKSPRLKVLGPDSVLVSDLDSKAEQVEVFRKLNLPHPHVERASNLSELKSLTSDRPRMVYAQYSSGGDESMPIRSAKDFDKFVRSLRKLNQTGPFIATDLMANLVLSPNVTGIVLGNRETSVVAITDQVLQGHRYLGNIYPSAATKNMSTEMEQAVVRIGNYLSDLGYRGLFGCDFIITDTDDCYVVDLNPRHQGGYFCTAMASPIDLVALECTLALGKPVDKLEHDNFQVPYSWMHSKLKPFQHVRIIRELNTGNPVDPFRTIGSSHAAIYYPAGKRVLKGNVGFYVTSGKTREDTSLRGTKEVSRLLRSHFRKASGA